MHSLKVEQVGRALVTHLLDRQPEYKDMIDADAVAAACLAHDLGHPPFGHGGERKLHDLLVCKRHRSDVRTIELRRDDPCKDCNLEDGFEGNAQTFRILTSLAVHRSSDEEKPYGLDLARLSLIACTKYPWTRGAPGRKASKWGAYDADAHVLEWCTGKLNSDPEVNAQIMDWADDISYAVHDIEDFFRIGLVPLDQLHSGQRFREGFRPVEDFMEYAIDAVGELPAEDPRAVFDKILDSFPDTRFAGSARDLRILDELRNVLLERFITSCSIEDGQLIIQSKAKRLNQVLQQLTWYYVIDNPALSTIQVGQKRVIEDIFCSLRDLMLDTYSMGGKVIDPDSQKLRRLPFGMQYAINVALSQPQNGEDHYPPTRRQRLFRGLVDYICSLNDNAAYSLHSKLTGEQQEGFLHSTARLM